MKLRTILRLADLLQHIALVFFDLLPPPGNLELHLLVFQGQPLHFCSELLVLQQNPLVFVFEMLKLQFHLRKI